MPAAPPAPTAPPAPDIQALQVQGLHFAYAGEPPLFSALGFTLGAGVHRLHGESGSGKTTLLQLLAGERRFGGQCRLNGLAPATDAAAWPAPWFTPAPGQGEGLRRGTVPQLRGVRLRQATPNSVNTRPASGASARKP